MLADQRSAHVILALLGLVLVVGATACRFDSSIGTTRCSESQEGERSSDGDRICRDGFWVAVDATADASQDGTDDTATPPDTGPPADSRTDSGPTDTGPDTTSGDTSADTDDAGDTRADTDGGCTNPTTWYEDADGDGFGAAGTGRTACNRPSGYVSNDRDCDDSTASIAPDQSESCNDVDDDCDGLVDEGANCPCTYDPTEPNDIDTGMDFKYGVCRNQTIDSSGTCTTPGEFVSRTDDEQAANECDGLDNDCDDTVDEGCGCTYDPNETNNIDSNQSHNAGICTNQPLDSSGTCQQPNGFESKTNSEASCDGADNDCDGGVDEGCPCTYDPNDPDRDDNDNSHGTGVCTGQSRNANGLCSTPSTFESRTATESRCDGNDNDCDGTVDEGCSCTYDPGESRNVDTNNSHDSGICPGQTVTTSGTCPAPTGFEPQSPGETSCDGTDNDCDGSTDESSTDKSCYTGVTSPQTVGTGLCAAGTRECSGGSYGACTGDTIQSTHPTTYEVDCSSGSGDEDCDGTANDCGFLDTFPVGTARVRGLAVDPNSGDVFMAGDDRRRFSTDNMGVARYDTSGNQQWLWVQGSEGVQARDIALDPGNNRIYVVGRAVDSIDGNSISGPSDGFLARFDYSGNLQNLITVGTNDRDALDAVAFDSNANAISVVGSTGGTIGSSNNGGFDAFIAEYNSGLQQKWVTQFGTGQNDYGEALDIVPSSGALFVGGDTSGQLGGTPQGGRDAFVAKYDTTGSNQMWSAQVGSSADDDVRSLSVDPGNAVYIAGETEGALGPLTHAGGEDAFVGKFTASGARKWLDSVATGSADVFDEVRFDPDSSTIFAVGTTVGAPATTSNAGGRDVLVVAYNPDSSRRWMELRGTGDNDYGLALASSPSSGSLFIGGLWEDGSTFGGDGFLARIK